MGEEGPANLGAGCLDPWSSSGWNTPLSGLVRQSPLSYNRKPEISYLPLRNVGILSHPYVEFDYSAATGILGNANTPKVAQDSSLILYQSPPTGFKTLKIGFFKRSKRDYLFFVRT
jgi:hypothetical protein